MPFPVTLTVINAESIDAFATMGGYVYITTGLIGMCDKEEELAGVIAHEFAHIKKRHIAKRLEKQKYLNIGMLTTMLLGMLVGAGSTPEAIITSGIAGTQAMALKYSREDEEEADREGSAIADKAGYGGLGSVAFLKKLRTAGSDKLLPQYLLTHPYHEARIVVLESMWKENKVTIDAPFFPFVSLRVQVLHKSARVGDDDIVINRYLKDASNPANNYGAALVYSQKGNTAESIRVAKENKSPFRNLFLGEMFINARKFSEAVDTLKNDTDPVARFLLARAYESQNKYGPALSTLKEILPIGTVFPEIYYRLGMLFGRTGQQAKGHEYLGRFYMETGKFSLARTNLEKAVSLYGINSPEAKAVLQILDGIKDGKNSAPP
jgi:predicted Zn-dependent protease